MDILEQLNEVEKKLGETPETPEATQVIEEPAQEAPSVVEETPTEEVTEPEEVKAEAEDEVEEKPKTASDYVKERRQSKKELEQELINARAQLAAMQAIQASKVEPKPEPVKQSAPNPQEDPDGYRDYVLTEQAKALQATQAEIAQMKNQVLMQSAKAELAQMEASFAERVPDYREVMADAEARMAEFFRIKNPTATDAQIKAMVEADKFDGALNATRMGKDPVETLYTQVKALFRYQPTKTVEGKTEAEKLAAVAANKKKAASGLTAGGSQGGSYLGPDALLKMTPAQYAKLTDAERARFTQ
ncbi:hypothetical protein UFOVP826_60 [uncultured Caudovirales phage]|uniref:Scaffolding protein n=1 Tax=uncultured Caudovirales phage TaxID=2100421 RepID=A0A6J5P0L1_9CAUD|nr:hypothetical protein UFOVP826_60 [uncultured Caudovirales phage]